MRYLLFYARFLLKSRKHHDTIINFTILSFYLRYSKFCSVYPTNCESRTVTTFVYCIRLARGIGFMPLMHRE